MNMSKTTSSWKMNGYGFLQFRFFLVVPWRCVPFSFYFKIISGVKSIWMIWIKDWFKQLGMRFYCKSYLQLRCILVLVVLEFIFYSAFPWFFFLTPFSLCLGNACSHVLRYVFNLNPVLEDLHNIGRLHFHNVVTQIYIPYFNLVHSFI
jgi:hypothetical protein